MPSRTSLLSFGVPWLALSLGAAGARADFVAQTNAPSPLQSARFFLTANQDVSSFSGTVGGTQAGLPVVHVTTIGNVNTGAGFAGIKPVSGGTLTSLTFTPANPNGFDYFCFLGQVLQSGTVTVTVQDNQGHPPQHFDFPITKGSVDFGRIGILAKEGSGETIKSVTISDPQGFKEIAQVAFTPALAAVPEPAGLTLLGLGAACATGFGWRRRKGAVA
jgi:hypothetical protein